MSTGASDQYHFSREQRILLGQVYRLILDWRRARLAAQAKQVDRDTSTLDNPIDNRSLVESGMESSEA